jgi:lysophospholipase L1-like esterase
MKAYFRVRLAEVDDPSVDPGNRENLLFKSNKIDTDNPIRDWYQTIRTSKFEDDLYKKYGYRFTSIAHRKADGSIVFRAGKVKLKDLELPDVLSPNELRAVRSGDVDLLDKYLKKYIEVEVYATDKDARRMIKKAVEAETHSWQVIKRRHVRKNIQNLIGIRDWRFFEKTRNDIDDKKRNIRNKIMRKTFPESTKSGKYILCLFGVNDCRASTDPIDEEVRSSTATTTGKNQYGKPDEPDPNDPNKTVSADDGTIEKKLEEASITEMTKTADDAAGKTTKELTAQGLKMSIIKTLMTKLNIATDLVSWLDTLNRIDKGIKNHTLVKMVTVSRGTQALGLFTTFATASDQLRTGEVTGPEVGKFMETINAVSNSEGWTEVLGSSKTAVQAAGTEFTAAKNKEEYCSPEHQTAIQGLDNRKIAEREFHYLCGDKQIGGSSRAASLEKWWNNTFGKVIGPILDNYIANFFFKVLNWFSDIIGKYILGPIMEIILKITGLEIKVETIMGWALTEISSFLGAGPMMNGTEPSGIYMNTMVQGGAYGSESSARYQGAALTTNQSATLARETTIAFNKDESKNKSIFDKYISLDNSESSASKTLIATIENTTVNNTTGILGSIIKLVGKAPLGIFTSPAGASKDDSYTAANFAAIDTYDFPQQCYDLDPLTMKPKDVTNADDLKDPDGNPWIPASELTWDLVNNNIAFYDKLYLHMRKHYPNNADDYANKIYDCAALDTTLRGGLGALYGYTKDNGLEDNMAANSDDNEDANNSKVYVLGNSLTHGMDDVLNIIGPELVKNKYKPIINGQGGRQLTVSDATVNSGLDQAKKDKDKIATVGSIIIELGTNGCSENSSLFTSHLKDLYDYLKGVNPTAIFYWQNYATASDSTSTCYEDIPKRNIDLNNFASPRGITIIDWASVGPPYLSVANDGGMGLHPTSAGYKKMVDKIIETLGPAPTPNNTTGNN